MNHETKQVGFTRRKLVIGAPTALLLGACGSGDMAVAELGSNKIELSAPSAVGTDAGQVITETPLTSEDAKVFQSMNTTVDSMDEFQKLFLFFCTSKFTNYQKAAAAHALLKISGRQDYDTGAILSNVGIAEQLYNALTAAQKTAYTNLMVSYCTARETFGMTVPYTTAGVDDFRYRIWAFSDVQIIHMKQRMPHLHDIVMTFMSCTFTIALFQEFKNRINSLETIDDRRHLSGTVPDSVAIVPGTIYGETDKFAVKLGNLRKPAERTEFDYIRPWYASWMFGGDNITDASKIQAGINNFTNVSTFTDSTGWTVTSTANKIQLEQSQGINHYVDKDFAKNGAMPGLSGDQTKRMLTEYTEFVERKTGRVYESYIIAQFFLRATQQAVIGMARFRILNKKIDLAVLQQTLTDELMANADVYHLYRGSQNQVAAVCISLIGLMIPSVYLAGLTVTVADDVSKDLAASTVAVQTAEVVKRMTHAMTMTQSITTMASVGIFFAGAMLDKSKAKATIQRAIPSAFAVSDLAGGIGDILTVFKLKQQNTATGALQIIAGCARLTTALSTFVEVLYKIYHNDYSKVYQTTIPSLSIGTIAAVVSGSVYALIGAYNLLGY